jgi:hypothetical protein
MILMRKTCVVAGIILALWMASSAVYAQEKRDKFEFSQQFSLLFDRDTIADTNTSYDGIRPRSRKSLMGIGAAFTYSPLRYLGLDSEYTFYAKNDFLQPLPNSYSIGNPPISADYRTANYNGPEHVALFGIRAGVQTKKIGLFVKARPGFAAFHPVYDCLPVANVNDYTVNAMDRCSETRMLNFAMDAGGVAELYLPHRAFIRLDAGDTYLKYGKTTMLFLGSTTRWINHTYGEDDRHHFQLKLGLGIKF